MTRLENCRLIQLPTIEDSRGNLTVIEDRIHAPFNIRRVYYLHDVPVGAERGGHAHRELWQLLVALAGSLDVVIDDGAKVKRVTLSKPNLALLICPMIWRSLENFSHDSRCLVLASEHYNEQDYYRSYSDFLTDAQRL